jgi:tetratricopeptide (TPR) repeat protein
VDDPAPHAQPGSVVSRGGLLRGGFALAAAHRRCLAAIALLLLTLLAYAPVVRCGFIWDDDDYVSANETLRSVSGLARIWCDPSATPQYYPLVHTTLWLEYRLWGPWPPGYHVVNVLIHAVSALLVWQLLRRLEVPGAWLAAAIFALHPVQVESVAWITERKNVLSLCFYLGAVWVYLRSAAWTGRPQSAMASAGNYACLLLLFGCALLSKTTACTLPAALLLLRYWKRKGIGRRDLMAMLPLLAIGLAMGLVTVYLERHHVLARGADWNFTWYDRLLIASRAVWFYAGKLVWPSSLTFFYPRWQIDAGLWWQWLFLPSLLATLAALAVGGRRFGRGPLTAVLFFLGTLVPALGFFNIYPMRYSFVADHFQYVAGIGLIALAAAVIFSAAQRLPVPHPHFEFSAAGLLLALLLALTFRQTFIYRDLETLWRDTIAKNPRAWMACNNLAYLLRMRGDTVDSRTLFEDSLRINPRSPESHNNLGELLSEQGLFPEAQGHFEEALRLEPDYPDARNNYGQLLAATGRYAAAYDQFAEALRLNPQLSGAYNNWACALAREGRREAAIERYYAALRIDPRNAQVHSNLAVLLMATEQQRAEAQQHFQAALDIAPEFADAHYNFGNLLTAERNFAAAETHFRTALRINPDHRLAAANLGALLALEGRPEEAVRLLTAVVQAAPADLQARKNLAAAYERMGNHAAAIAALREAVRLNPDDVDARNRLQGLEAPQGR